MILKILFYIFILINLVGLGYLTDLVFKNKKTSDYNETETNLMKMYVVVNWLSVLFSVVIIVLTFIGMYKLRQQIKSISPFERDN